MQTAISAFPETLPGLLLLPLLLPETKWEEISLEGRQGPGRRGIQAPEFCPVRKQLFRFLSDLLPDLDEVPCHLLLTCFNRNLLSAEAELGEALLEGSCWGSHSMKGFVGMHSYILSKLEWALILRIFSHCKCTWGFISPLVCWDDTLRSFLHFRILTQVHSYLQQYLSFLDSWDSQPNSWPDEEVKEVTKHLSYNNNKNSFIYRILD